MRDPDRVLRQLAVLVAVGFGVLGWLGSHLAMMRFLVHGHSGAGGQHYHHADGYLAPAALISAAMTASALLAVRTLAVRREDAPARTRARGSETWAVGLAATGGFLALELIDSAVLGAHPGRPTVSLLLASLLHVVIAAATARIGRGCVRFVVQRSRRRRVLLVAGPSPALGRAKATEFVLAPQQSIRPALGRAPPSVPDLAT
jgi:hypothetical protein